MADFNPAYLGVPPWDIGRPQREIVRLAESGQIRGHVLDVGCGTGENALYLAGLGHEVWGIDAAPLAIEKAQAKAKKREVAVTFKVFDALQLEHLGKIFDTVIDTGLFHTFADEERPLFEKGLARTLGRGGNYFLLCFSDREPGEWGPRRISQDEIRATFAKGWRVNSIQATRFEHNLDADGARAWLASITRLSV